MEIDSPKPVADILFDNERGSEIAGVLGIELTDSIGTPGVARGDFLVCSYPACNRRFSAFESTQPGTPQQRVEPCDCGMAWYCSPAHRAADLARHYPVHAEALGLAIGGASHGELFSRIISEFTDVLPDVDPGDVVAEAEMEDRKRAKPGASPEPFAVGVDPTLPSSRRKRKFERKRRVTAGKRSQPSGEAELDEAKLREATDETRRVAPALVSWTGVSEADSGSTADEYASMTPIDVIARHPACSGLLRSEGELRADAARVASLLAGGSMRDVFEACGIALEWIPRLVTGVPWETRVTDRPADMSDDAIAAETAKDCKAGDPRAWSAISALRFALRIAADAVRFYARMQLAAARDVIGIVSMVGRAALAVSKFIWESVARIVSAAWRFVISRATAIWRCFGSIAERVVGMMRAVIPVLCRTREGASVAVDCAGVFSTAATSIVYSGDLISAVARDVATSGIAWAASGGSRTPPPKAVATPKDQVNGPLHAVFETMTRVFERLRAMFGSAAESKSGTPGAIVSFLYFVGGKIGSAAASLWNGGKTAVEWLVRQATRFIGAAGSLIARVVRAALEMSGMDGFFGAGSRGEPDPIDLDAKGPALLIGYVASGEVKTDPPTMARARSLLERCSAAIAKMGGRTPERGRAPLRTAAVARGIAAGSRMLAAAIVKPFCSGTAEAFCESEEAAGIDGFMAAFGAPLWMDFGLITYDRALYNEMTAFVAECYPLDRLEVVGESDVVMSSRRRVGARGKRRVKRKSEGSMAPRDYVRKYAGTGHWWAKFEQAMGDPQRIRFVEVIRRNPLAAFDIPVMMSAKEIATLCGDADQLFDSVGPLAVKSAPMEILEDIERIAEILAWQNELVAAYSKAIEPYAAISDETKKSSREGVQSMTDSIAKFESIRDGAAARKRAIIESRPTLAKVLKQSVIEVSRDAWELIRRTPKKTVDAATALAFGMFGVAVIGLATELLGSAVTKKSYDEAVANERRRQGEPEAAAPKAKEAGATTESKTESQTESTKSEGFTAVLATEESGEKRGVLFEDQQTGEVRLDAKAVGGVNSVLIASHAAKVAKEQMDPSSRASGDIKHVADSNGQVRDVLPDGKFRDARKFEGAPYTSDMREKIVDFTGDVSKIPSADDSLLRRCGEAKTDQNILAEFGVAPMRTGGTIVPESTLDSVTVESLDALEAAANSTSVRPSSDPSSIGIVDTAQYRHTPSDMMPEEETCSVSGGAWVPRIRLTRELLKRADLSTGETQADGSIVFQSRDPARRPVAVPVAAAAAPSTSAVPVAAVPRVADPGPISVFGGSQHAANEYVAVMTAAGLMAIGDLGPVSAADSVAKIVAKTLVQVAAGMAIGGASAWMTAAVFGSAVYAATPGPYAELVAAAVIFIFKAAIIVLDESPDKASRLVDCALSVASATVAGAVVKRVLVPAATWLFARISDTTGVAGSSSFLTRAFLTVSVAMIVPILAARTIYNPSLGSSEDVPESEEEPEGPEAEEEPEEPEVEESELEAKSKVSPGAPRSKSRSKSKPVPPLTYRQVFKGRGGITYGPATPADRFPAELVERLSGKDRKVFDAAIAGKVKYSELLGEQDVSMGMLDEQVPAVSFGRTVEEAVSK